MMKSYCSDIRRLLGDGLEFGNTTVDTLGLLVTEVHDQVVNTGVLVGADKFWPRAYWWCDDKFKTVHGSPFRSQRCFEVLAHC